MPQETCPTEQELTAFLLGELPETTADTISAHLEKCPHCETAAQSLDNVTDAAIEALRLLNRDLPPASVGIQPREIARGAELSGPRSQARQGLPEQLDDYEILEELGRGGMGVVYKAWQTSLRRTVALKMMLGSRFADGETRARFRTEAEAVARLQHPNIVQIFHIGEVEGQPYFTLEYIDGGSLDQFTGKPQFIPQSVEWLKSLARAVQYAHRAGIIHRDLKPDNILLGGDGQLKITDFGVAKWTEGSRAQTASGLILGTAEYMAPEQADAQRDVGPTADIYSLGAILYTLLTGRPPFQAASVLETLEQVKSQEPVPPRQLRQQLPRDLETICLKCLEKDPSHRYPTADALAEDLKRFEEGRPIEARPLGAGTRAWRWARRNRAVALLTVLAATLLIVLVTGAVIEMRLAQDRAQEEIENREVLERQLYHTYIALAERECSANNMRRAAQLLEACPEDLRGWEWHYLNRRRYENDIRLRGPLATRINAVAFSSDGRYLAVAAPGLDPIDAPAQGMKRLIPQSPAGTLTLWDLSAQREYRRLKEDENSYHWALSFSPDDHALASGGENGLVKIWDAKTGEIRHVLTGHQGAVRTVAYHPEGSLLASGGDDGTIRLWNAKTAQPVMTLKGHVGAVFCVAYRPDGQLLASAGNDKTVRFWDVISGQEIQTLHDHAAIIEDLAYHPDGHSLATVSAGRIRLWDVSSGKEISRFQPHYADVLTVAFSPDGKRIASGGSDRTIRIWDATSGAEILTLHNHADSVFRVVFSRDGLKLASTGRGGDVIVWDATPITKEIFQDLITLRGHLASVESVAFSPDGRLLASASLDKTVRIWDRATARCIRTLKHENSQPVASVAFHPEGGRLASINAQGAVIVWNVMTGEVVQTIKAHSKGGTCLAYSRDGKFLASGCQDGKAKLWDAATGQMRYAFQCQSAWVNGLAFSHAGEKLAAAADNGIVQVWETTTGKECICLGRNSLAVTDVAFSPDDQFLAGSSRDESIKIWNVSNGNLRQILHGHTHRVHAVAYSPDGKSLASASDDETARIWDTITGWQILVLRGHTDIVNTVTFSSDSQWVATGSRDGTIKLWKTRRESTDSSPKNE